MVRLINQALNSGALMETPICQRVKPVLSSVLAPWSSTASPAGVQGAIPTPAEPHGLPQMAKPLLSITPGAASGSLPGKTPQHREFPSTETSGAARGRNQPWQE